MRAVSAYLGTCIWFEIIMHCMKLKTRTDTNRYLSTSHVITNRDLISVCE